MYYSPLGPDRRISKCPRQSTIAASYDALGAKGVRRLRIWGGILATASTAAGLTVPVFADPPLAYYMLVGVFFVAGIGMVWPQYGIMLIGSIPAGLAKLVPVLTRAERREK